MAGPRLGKIPKYAGGALAACRWDVVHCPAFSLRAHFLCSFVAPALPLRPSALRTYQPPFFTSPHPSTTSRPVRLLSALPLIPGRSPVLPSTCPDWCAFRPTSLHSARHGPVRPSLHLVHSNVTCCSLFAFLSPKQCSHFLNTLRELGISLIRLGIISSKEV